MITARPLPEAVRGGWYFYAQDSDPDRARDKGSLQVLHFRVDGTFRRHKLKAQRCTLAESGDYTFDGNFLILRGRRTHTYRVRRTHFWRWELEDKKSAHLLVRGILDAPARAVLPDEARRDIRLLPLRARIEPDCTGDDPIYRIVYEGDATARRLLATFFVEAQGPERFIGLSPLVEGIAPATWERITRESFLDMYLGGPDDIDEVTLMLLDAEKPRRFDYDSPAS